VSQPVADRAVADDALDDGVGQADATDDLVRAVDAEDQPGVGGRGSAQHVQGAPRDLLPRAATTGGGCE
jgi:hypothetical protein